MKKNVLILLLLGMLVPVNWLQAQDSPASLTLTVQQAVDYSLKNNKNIESARYDIMSAEKGKWEAISAGLPTVDGSVGLTNNLIIPTMVFNGMSFKVGTNYELTSALSGSAVIFNAPYLIGIQTAKLASLLSQQGLQMTEIETKESVISTYYLILVTQETKKILEGNIRNMNESLISTKAMYNVGMAESTDVDQMTSTLASLENSLSSMERTIEVHYNMLRFLLGLRGNTEIVLTDSLDAIIIKINMEDILGAEFNINDNISYKIADNQVKMAELGYKATKSSVLPTLGVGYSISRLGRSDYLDSLSFSNSSYVGLQLGVPIFASGLRHTKIQRSKINLEKAKNAREIAEEQLLMQEKQLRYNLLSAAEQYKNQKANIEVADRVLKSIQNKYKQGMASSLDLTSANSNYLMAETNYLTSLMTLLQNKVAFDKLMSNL
jgi:outer membrane protein